MCNQVRPSAQWTHSVMPSVTNMSAVQSILQSGHRMQAGYSSGSKLFIRESMVASRSGCSLLTSLMH